MLQRKIKQSVRESSLSFKSRSWVWNGDQPTNHNVESKPVKMQKKRNSFSSCDVTQAFAESGQATKCKRSSKTWRVVAGCLDGNQT